MNLEEQKQDGNSSKTTKEDKLESLVYRQSKLFEGSDSLVIN